MFPGMGQNTEKKFAVKIMVEVEGISIFGSGRTVIREMVIELSVGTAMPHGVSSDIVPMSERTPVLKNACNLQLMEDGNSSND